MRRRIRRRRTRALVAGVLAAVVAAAASGCGDSGPAGSTGASPNASKYGTIEPGVLRVNITPYMPYTGYEHGKLTGFDGELIQEIADRLDLRVKVAVSDWAGMLAAVQSRRADIAGGSIAWTEQRAESGLFTEPPYYSPVALEEREGDDWTTLDDLEGKRIGTITGFLYIPALQQIPGATVRTYATAPIVLDDLAAGRIDVAMIDPLVMSYLAKVNPDLSLTTKYLQPPSAADLAAHEPYKLLLPYMSGYYIPRQETDLARAASRIVRDMYQDGTIQRLAAKWGADPSHYLDVEADLLSQFKQDRVAVDRPRTWQPPTVD